MLLSLLYHRVGNDKYANSLTLFKKHLSWIQKRYTSLLPGDPLTRRRSICLTFDDASFDFYHYIFPLLKKLALRAVLSVPVGFIPENVTLSPEERLERIGPLLNHFPPFPSPAYCSWNELREMQGSGLVHIASHSVSHIPLTSKGVDLQHELLSSKAILEKQLKTPILTFVYPFGKFNAHVHALVRKHYPYVMRIGNATNFSWQNTNQLFYRIPADALVHPQTPFGPFRQVRYFFRLIFNTLRKF